MAAGRDAIDYVFVLRFWREPPDDRADPMNWRARISEVNTGRQFHAIGVDGACNIVRGLLPPGGNTDTGR